MLKAYLHSKLMFSKPYILKADLYSKMEFSKPYIWFTESHQVALTGPPARCLVILTAKEQKVHCLSNCVSLTSVND